MHVTYRQFISSCYGMDGVYDMITCRQKEWASKVAKAGKLMPKLASLPPTTECFVENVKRTQLQAIVWRHALHADSPNVDPCEYG